MFDHDLISKKMEEYLNGDGLEQFEFIKSLNDIIVKNTYNRNIKKYKEKIDLDEVVTIVYSFFKSLSSYYASYFEKSLNSGNISFDKKYPIGISYYDPDLEQRIIQVRLTGNIEEAFVLVHEVLHDMNKLYLNSPHSRLLFTEGISMYGELLFRDFLIKNNLYPKDNYKSIIYDHLNVQMASESLAFELELIEEYLNNNHISINFLKDLYDRYDYDTADNSISFLTECADLELVYQQPYIIGELISCYMYDRSKNNPKYLCELMDINDIMNDVYFDELLTYLDLDVVENKRNLSLTDESLNKLERSYKKELKFK